MFKADNEDSRATPFGVVPVSLSITFKHFTRFSGFVIVDFKQVNVYWVSTRTTMSYKR